VSVLFSVCRNIIWSQYWWY